MTSKTDINRFRNKYNWYLLSKCFQLVHSMYAGVLVP